jgi:hypothetical protein
MRIIGCDLHARRQTIYQDFCIGIFDKIIAISLQHYAERLASFAGARLIFSRGTLPKSYGTVVKAPPFFFSTETALSLLPITFIEKREETMPAIRVTWRGHSLFRYCLMPC